MSYCKKHDQVYGIYCPICLLAATPGTQVKENQPAGKVPRWVNACERTSSDGEDVPLKINMGSDDTPSEVYSTGHYEAEKDVYKDEIFEVYIEKGKIKWLEEKEGPAQPTDNMRDNMLFAYKAGCIHGQRAQTTVGVATAFDKWYEKVLWVRSNYELPTETPTPGEPGVKKHIGYKCKKDYHASLDWAFKKGDFCTATQCEKLPLLWERVFAEEPAPVQGEVPEEWQNIKPWPLIAYAPGNYSCTCCHCKKEFFGDKRAVECLECAVKMTHQLIEKANSTIVALRNAAINDSKAAKEQIEEYRNALQEIHDKGMGAYLGEDPAKMLAIKARIVLNKYKRTT